jgi:phosphoribosyl 1,2-cyclic phosphodiesterase
MSVFVSSLNSGSNGNCYYLGTQDEGILVDAGISCRETVKRLKRLGLAAKKIKAIFITHEHGDHTHGASSLSKKYKIPVFITVKTFNAGRLEIDETLLRTFTAYEPVKVGNFQVIGFPKKHDAIDPHSFIVEINNLCVGVFTDIGAACDHVTQNFSRCHAAFLESNYDDDMLLQGSYPYHLKERIRGNLGHLSNEQALNIFLNHRSENLSHLFLSHLSQDNNSPKLVKNLFSKHAGKTEIIVASRQKESKLYHITQSTLRKKLFRSNYSKTQQLGLFA